MKRLITLAFLVATAVPMLNRVSLEINSPSVNNPTLSADGSGSPIPPWADGSGSPIPPWSLKA
jgi:hypothetical protein